MVFGDWYNCNLTDRINNYSYLFVHRVEGMQKILAVSSIPLAVIAAGKAEETPDARGFFDEARVKYL